MIQHVNMNLEFDTIIIITTVIITVIIIIIIIIIWIIVRNIGVFFIRKIFIKKWCSKTQKPSPVCNAWAAIFKKADFS